VKIAILSCFYPYRGGIAQFNDLLIKELGQEHTVKAYNFSRQYPNFFFPGKTQFVESYDKAVSKEPNAFLDTANPFSYIKTAKNINKWKPDILITRYWMSYFAPSLGYVARHVSKDCKKIAIIDNVIPHEKHFFDKPLTKYFLKSNDGFITLCKTVENDLLSFKADAHIITTPHPLYCSFGNKIERDKACELLKLSPDKNNILFFGLIRKYKGLDILIKAFSLLNNNYRLIIAGEPYGSFDEYQKLIDASPNKKNISLYNRYIPDTEVYKYFSASDVCVLPYRSATQSGISSIAYNFDLPMITTSVGGLKETIGDNGTGIITESEEPEEIAAKIDYYFSNDEIRESLINNIKIEKEKLSWKKFAKKIIELYKTLYK